MATLVERLRAIVSSEEDDFFEDEILVSYLNRSQQRVVSYCVALELSSRRSLRALDSLRKVGQQTAVSAPTLVSGTTYQGTVNVPADLLQLEYLRYDGTITMRELPVTKLQQLFDGNAQPSVNEGYFHHILNGSTKTLKVFVHESDAAATYDLFYVAKPTDINENATAFTSVPIQLENAILYGAAEMMLMQESAKDPNNGLATIRGIYTEELSRGIY